MSKQEWQVKWEPEDSTQWVGLDRTCPTFSETAGEENTKTDNILNQPGPMRHCFTAIAVILSALWIFTIV